MKYFYLLFLLFSVALMQGCPAPILIAGATGGAIVATDERNTRSMVDDQLIESRAKDKLYADPEIAKKIHINVTSFNGIVLLTGETVNQSLRASAVNYVRYMENVRRVHNEIRIGDLTDLNSRTNDGWITSKVKAQMLTAKGFKSGQVKVVTESGIVYLMGLVHKEAGDQAAEIARNVSGVKRVVKLFEYLQ